MIVGQYDNRQISLQKRLLVNAPCDHIGFDTLHNFSAQIEGAEIDIGSEDSDIDEESEDEAPDQDDDDDDDDDGKKENV